MNKNPYARTRPKDKPYAIYRDPKLPGWEWKILKTYQRPDKAAENKYARAFCLVTSPMTGPSGDLGDTYLDDIGKQWVDGSNILKESGRETI